jgi:hypothetical protein
MLSTVQIKALRAVRENSAAVDSLNYRTYSSLVRKGFIAANGNLTRYGREWIDSYVERTGDGPEDLKAMFRF